MDIHKCYLGYCRFFSRDTSSRLSFFGIFPAGDMGSLGVEAKQEIKGIAYKDGRGHVFVLVFKTRFDLAMTVYNLGRWGHEGLVERKDFEVICEELDKIRAEG